MDVTIVSEYSLWWVLLFALISGSIVYWLYFFKKSYSKDFSSSKIYLLAFLRWGAIVLLLFLLLEPKIKHSFYRTDKPILVFAQDNSKSLAISKDSVFFKNGEYEKVVGDFLRSAEESFRVDKITFGNKVKKMDQIDFSETTTNFSELIQFLQTNYANTNNVQVLIASDGVYNQGSDPRYLVKNLSFPIHSLQLGDTSRLEDVAVHFVRTNQFAFVNNKMPVRVEIKATNFDGESLGIKILNGNKELASADCFVKGNSFFIEKDFFITPEKDGLQKFKVELHTRKKEHSKRNNQYEFIVDVLDTKQKIAICFNEAHPDVAAIGSAINKNLNFTLDVFNLSREQPNVADYNLFVLYQLPSALNSYASFIQEIQQKEIPVLMILGGSTDTRIINQLQLPLKVNPVSNQFSESTFIPNNNFTLFDLKEEEKDLLQRMPPLLSPMGNYSFTSESQVLAFQRIKSVETNTPQIAFATNNNQKTAWILGEGLWRWKLHDYRLNDSPDIFNNFVNRIIQYLALKVKREQLVVKHKKSISEGDELDIEVELYNESFELINNAEVEFRLKDSKGNDFIYNFERNFNAYKLHIGSLNKGNYSYVVATKGLEKEREQSGIFIVSANNIEAVNLQTDRTVLSQISKFTGASSYSLNNLSDLLVDLSKNSSSKSTVIEELSYRQLVDLLIVLIVVIILLSLEWFLRKYWMGT